MPGFSGILSAWGERKTLDPYQPYKPYIRRYEGAQYHDVMSLYGEHPYDQPGLGYSDTTMEGMYAKGRDQLAGESAAARQKLSDYYRSGGGFGLDSGSYARALQRQNLSDVQQANTLRRDLLIANENQKRADLQTRLAAVGAAYGQGVGTYNAFTRGRNDRIRRIYSGVADFGNSVANAAGGGSFAG